MIAYDIILNVREYRVIQDGQGYKISRDNKQWEYSLSYLSTIKQMLKLELLAHGGGTIKVERFGSVETITVDPCPTNHANMRDDFMGGMVCMDCRCVW